MESGCWASAFRALGALGSAFRALLTDSEEAATQALSQLCRHDRTLLFLLCHVNSTFLRLYCERWPRLTLDEEHRAIVLPPLYPPPNTQIRAVWRTTLYKLLWAEPPMERVKLSLAISDLWQTDK